MRGAFDAALADGARVASPNGAAGDGPGRANVMSVASTENLERVAELLDAEALRALGTSHTQGKLAVAIA